jgi:hypothetical protein
MTEAPPYLRPPPDPYLRKGKPIVNPDAPKSTSIAEVLNRGQQLLLELDRQHKRTHDAVMDALKPDPQAWRQVRAAHTDYVKAFAELTQLSKRLNRLIQEENPEPIIPPTPPETATFGDVVTVKKKGRR